MPAAANLPSAVDDAIIGVFERTINETRIFWTQRPDGSLRCADWEWCCPEVPAILGGLDAVVFVTRGSTRARLVAGDILVVSLDASRVWGEWPHVLDRVPRDMEAITWDDSLSVRI